MHESKLEIARWLERPSGSEKALGHVLHHLLVGLPLHLEPLKAPLVQEGEERSQPDPDQHDNEGAVQNLPRGRPDLVPTGVRQAGGSHYGSRHHRFLLHFAVPILNRLDSRAPPWNAVASACHQAAGTPAGGTSTRILSISRRCGSSASFKSAS